MIAASTGSARHSGRVELSPVLRAMGISEEVGRGAIRFSLGRSTTGRGDPRGFGADRGGATDSLAGRRMRRFTGDDWMIAVLVVANGRMSSMSFSSSSTV